jgi:glycosyltransferase involved in cell wall biosynthesis
MEEKSPTALFFAKYPPPHTGMTIATETFTDMSRDAIDVDCIDTSYGQIRPDDVGLEWIQYYLEFSSQLARSYRNLYRRLRRRSYEIFYFVTSPSLLGHWRNRVGLEIARPRVRRVVAHVHNGNFPRVFDKAGTSGSARRMVDAVDTFVFLNRSLSEQAEDHIPPEKRVIVPNTIDEHVRCSDEEVESKIELRTQKDTLRVLYLSNMIETKGYRDVAEAVNRFNREETRARLDFVGDWPSAKAQKQFEKRAQFRHTDAMYIHGKITDRSRVRQMLLEADVFVLPTYYPNEAQPISIIEAMNAGTPIIATEHASIPEYVFDDENGYLVNKQSPSQIASCLEKLYKPSNWVQKARAARKTYLNKFSPSAVRERMVDALIPST